MGFNKLKGKKVLITGGAGFIGSNLCDSLTSLDCEVVCLDNFSTGKFENISALTSRSNFQLVFADIRNLEDCIKYTEQVDYILHQAALGSVPRSIKNPIKSHEVNVDGFINILEAARVNNVKRIVYAASSSTYGDSQQLPKVEDKIGKPLSPYAATKLINEIYADIYSKTFGLECIGLRYFNVFGRKQDPNGAYAAVIPKFFDSLINDKPPTINGNGSQTRDFTYVDNVIQANLLSLSTENPKAINSIFNVAYGDRYSLNDLFQIIKDALVVYNKEVSALDPVYGPPRAGDVQHSHADIGKARELLGYNPEFSLKDGIIEASKWYWENLKNKNGNERN